MLRSTARCLSRSLSTTTPPPTSLSISRYLRLTVRAPFALTLPNPGITSLVRTASSAARTPFDAIDGKQIANTHLKAHPGTVSTESSVRHVLSEEGANEVEKDIDMLAGVKSDLKTIRETFNLEDVPKEALYIGMAGLLPYVATSLSTVYLAWDINHAAMYGQGFLLSGPTAEAMLHLVEPLQIGYGAVIISFLGAIHWGLEWAQYGGVQGYPRYATGLIATALAWPTMLLPVEYALIAQFLAFNYLYFTDARAAAKGLAPPWYGTYRFVLTFVVGASLVISLVGRGQIADKINRPSGPADRLRALREAQMASLEKEEREMDGEGDD